MLASVTALAVASTAPALIPRPAAQDAPRVRAFTGVRLFDGTGGPPIDEASLVVRDGRVVAAGRADRVQIPADAERVPLPGKTLIPGLVNAHGHVNDPARDLATYAAYGVTTVYSLGDEPDGAFAARRAQQAPGLARSRVFLAGPVLNPASEDSARAAVRANKARGVDVIKIRVDDNLGTTPKMAPSIYRAVIDESHAQGLRTAVHLFYLEDAKAVLDAGADLIAHSVRDVAVDEGLIARMNRRNICLVPTLMREVSTFTYDAPPAFFSDPQFAAHADRSWVADLSSAASQAKFRSSPSAARYRAALDVAMQNLRRLHAAGVTIAMGTDTGPMGRFQGYFEWMELDLMVKAGLTPREALLASTRDAARCQQLDADVGTIEPGKWADFLVLNADPLSDIRNVRRLSDVYIAGTRVDRIAR
jgi:imidazolonepropionase-like amidohydrolase